jgi:hypothetical protein
VECDGRIDRLANTPLALRDDFAERNTGTGANLSE